MTRLTRRRRGRAIRKAHRLARARTAARRAAVTALARDISGDTPPDQTVRTR